MQDRALSRASPDSAFSYTKAHGPTGKENVRKADCKAATPFGQNLCGARVIFESPGIILPLPRVDCIMYVETTRGDCRNILIAGISSDNWQGAGFGGPLVMTLQTNPMFEGP